MASGSSSSSMLFDATFGISGNMEFMTNTQQSAQDPNSDVAVVVSPTTLLDPNRYICEVCFKGFSRKQNLSLHNRVHNLPFSLKTSTSNNPVPRKVYLCPEPTCVYHNRSNAKRDFGGLKKHYLRKHCTQKNYICDICSKAYSVETDLKAHAKVCAKRNSQSGSRSSRGNFSAHQQNRDARERVGAVTTVSHPQTFGMRDNTNSLTSPHLPGIQTQSNSHPFTTPHQSQFHQFEADTGYYPNPLMDTTLLHNVNFDHMNIHQDGGLMHGPSSSISMPPCRPNLGLQGLFNPMTGSSDLGSYGQGGYHGYGVGNGPLAYSHGIEMSNIQHQQQLQNENFQDMNVHQGGGNIYGADPSSPFNLTPTSHDHNLNLNGMLNPMTGGSVMGSNGQGGYQGYGVGNYSGGMDILNFQHQQQQPLHNVDLAGMNVHGDWRGVVGTGEGNNTFYDGGVMPDPSNSLNMTPTGLNQGLNGMLDPVAGSSGVGGYEHQGYMGYDVGTGPIDYGGGMQMFNFEQQR